MITPAWVQKMAAYNRWMNDGLYAAAATLSDEMRKEDCGAFFGSIHATLNHVLWGDQIWMHRLADFGKPEAPDIAGSVYQHEDFSELSAERTKLDDAISDWAERIDPDWLTRDTQWFSGSVNRDVVRPNWVLVTHMFNHQTHHRGQVHCMLTRFGAKTPATDLPFLPLK